MQRFRANIAPGILPATHAITCRLFPVNNSVPAITTRMSPSENVRPARMREIANGSVVPLATIVDYIAPGPMSAPAITPSAIMDTSGRFALVTPTFSTRSAISFGE